jgi:hypothetical protein
VFENRVLRTMSEAKRDEVIRGWKELRNEELQGLLFIKVFFNKVLFIKVPTSTGDIRGACGMNKRSEKNNRVRECGFGP